ncbi:RH40 [Symbiodinium natans]|uniref:RH40 protein n=1 Tax=Symbiodinium natans TaxID=878477 RepID=A0A812IF97_9DINO|nr:RH40 [Symbiodinium natans]
MVPQISQDPMYVWFCLYKTVLCLGTSLVAMAYSDAGPCSCCSQAPTWSTASSPAQRNVAGNQFSRLKAFSMASQRTDVAKALARRQRRDSESRQGAPRKVLRAAAPEGPPHGPARPRSASVSAALERALAFGVELPQRPCSRPSPRIRGAAYMPPPVGEPCRPYRKEPAWDPEAKAFRIFCDSVASLTRLPVPSEQYEDRCQRQAIRFVPFALFPSASASRTSSELRPVPSQVSIELVGDLVYVEGQEEDGGGHSDTKMLSGLFPASAFNLCSQGCSDPRAKFHSDFKSTLIDALVLAPTRELARQIQLEALRFGRSSGILCCNCTGGESKGEQLEWLKRGCHIIVATPGRLNEAPSAVVVRLPYKAADSTLQCNVAKGRGGRHRTYTDVRHPRQQQSGGTCRRPLALLLAGCAAGDFIAREFEMDLKENISIPITPGFTALSPYLPGKLVVTSFEATPFVGKNGVFLVDVGAHSGPAQELPGSGKINWPNSITTLNASVFGFTAVAVGNGFLVPTHTTGGVYILEASTQPTTLKEPVKISKDLSGRLPDSGWFYHQAHFVDMDGDGRQDVLTARCEYGVWPWDKKQGELVWLKQPAKDALNGQPWEERELGPGPDFLFCVHPNSSRLSLVAPEFVSGRVVYWYMQEDGSMRSRLLDDTIGPGFSCSWVDLNADGHLDLLVTNHAAENGSVFAYSFSSEDIVTAGVSRHVLATGFTPAKIDKGKASPGDAMAFQPQTNLTGKPHIFVSGDNSNSIFLLTPKSKDPANWTYMLEQVQDFGADIGRPSIGDVDGNGFADIFVPLYDAKKIVHYEFRPRGRAIEIHV